ncbi:MAG: insulinase family protein [Rhodobacteraceae bacterium]|nr:insulinase family protein [Paracoccaceae bacterium]
MTRLFLIAAVILFSALPLHAQIKIQEVTSPGGIKAWLVEEHAIPFVALQIGFRGGSALDPAGKQGATNLMMGLLEEGTGDMDAAAFLRASEELAADFGFSARRDSLVVSARVLTSNAHDALALLKQAITEPAFNPAAFTRVQRQVLSGLKSDESDPDAIAWKTMNGIAFGDHPYGRAMDGTIESVTALTPDDMGVAHRAGLTRDHLVVGVVGDVTAAELGPMLDALLGDLPETGADLPPRIEFEAPGGTAVIEFDTPQSVAIWAHKGIDRHDPEFMSTYVMMHILGGGGFGSRLTDEVREKRGLTYGVYSYLAPLDHSNYAGGGVSSANDRIGEAIEVIRAEWARMATGDVTAEELQMAQQYLTGSYPLRFDSNAKIARTLVGMQLDFLPIDYVNTRNDKVNALTLEQVSEAARRLLDPEALQFVVVGKPEGVEATE